MIRSARPFALALSVLAALAGASPARAADCVIPIGVIRSTPTADPTVREFTGRVSPFGRITGELSIFMDPATGAFMGQIEIWAEGGTITGSFEGQAIPLGDFALLTEEITFTGGTGRFAGISGYAEVMGVLDLTTGEGRDTVVGGRVCLGGG